MAIQTRAVGAACMTVGMGVVGVRAHAPWTALAGTAALGLGSGTRLTGHLRLQVAKTRGDTFSSLTMLHVCMHF